MNKFYIKGTNKEVKVGDHMILDLPEALEFLAQEGFLIKKEVTPEEEDDTYNFILNLIRGNKPICSELLVKQAEESFMKKAEEAMAPRVRNKREMPIKRKTIPYFINKLALRDHCKYEEMMTAVTRLFHVSSSAFINLILKEVAMDMDQKYKDHISNSERIYTWNPITSVAKRIPKEDIHNLANFAAFRTFEDMMEGIKLTKKLYHDFSKINGRK